MNPLNLASLAFQPAAELLHLPALPFGLTSLAFSILSLASLPVCRFLNHFSCCCCGCGCYTLTNLMCELLLLVLLDNPGV